MTLNMFTVGMPNRNLPQIPTTSPVVGEPQSTAGSKVSPNTSIQSKRQKKKRPKTKTSVGFELDFKIPTRTKTKTKEKSMKRTVKPSSHQTVGHKLPGGNPISLNSGVKPKTYIKQYENAIYTSDATQRGHTFTPVKLMAGALTPYPSAETYTKDLFMERVWPQWLATAQSNVNYNLSSLFTQDNLRSTLNTLTDCLQLYYCIDGVIRYKSSGWDSNLMMDKMYEAVCTPEVLDYQDRLKRRLEGRVVPPNLLHLVRWLYQTYLDNPTQKANVLKVSFRGILTQYAADSTTGEPLTTQNLISLYQTLIAEMNTTSFTTCDSVMRRTRENWIVNELPASNEKPVYDRQFMTFWKNSIIVGRDHNDNTMLYPTSALDTSELYYASYCNEDELDGVVYALSSIADSNGVQQLGLFISASSYIQFYDNNNYFNTNRQIVTEVDTYTVEPAVRLVDAECWNAVYSVNTDDMLQTVSDITRTYKVPDGMNKLALHSINNIKQAMNDTSDWLNGLDDLREYRTYS